LNDKAVVDTLKALGVTVPATMQAAHARGQALKTANSLLPISSVDAALTRAGVDVQNRIRFKTALSRHGILGQ
jgi:hypothetical protein